MDAMKPFAAGILIGVAVAAFGLWRLEVKRMSSSGCLLPFIFTGLGIASIGILVLI